MIFVGVDVGKRTHTVCFLGDDGHELARSLRIPHTGAGVRALQERLAALPGPKQVVMEASGAHWLGLDRYFRAAGLPVQVVNPLQTAGLRKLGIRKAKTDKKDARLVADLARIGRARPSYVPDDAVLQLRDLVRHRWHLSDRVGDAKRRVLAILDKVFPEFSQQLSDPFGATGRELLSRGASAAEFAALDLGELEAGIRRASHQQLGRATAEAVQAAAHDSLGVACLGAVAHLEVRGLLAQIALLEGQIAAADALIEQLLAAWPRHVQSLPGVRGMLAATLLAELGDVRRFRRVEEVVAFAGLDASVFESGEFRGTRQHISKRGSPHLRRALYLAARQAVAVDPELAAFMRRKLAEGKPSRVALIAVSRKLLARVYAVLRDGRPYRIGQREIEARALGQVAQEPNPQGTAGGTNPTPAPACERRDPSRPESERSERALTDAERATDSAGGLVPRPTSRRKSKAHPLLTSP
jgi:transposase